MAEQDFPKDFFDLMQKMWNPMSFPLPGMITPTVDVGEIDKKIGELKTVETWLTMNTGFVQMTIKTLEMQKAALESLGQWAAIAPRLARAESVRAALLLVERGEAPLGIVYRTDAQVTAGVKLLGSFPPGSHPPITYPFAVTRRAAGRAEARALLAWLAGPGAAGTWRRFGFTAAAP